MPLPVAPIVRDKENQSYHSIFGCNTLLTFVIPLPGFTHPVHIRFSKIESQKYNLIGNIQITISNPFMFTKVRILF